MRMTDWSPVTRYTRARRMGRDIKCPNCGWEGYVYHFDWTALSCQNCKSSITKYEWLVQA